MANKKHSSVLGITLIELMIVLIIIGILASLALLRFSNAAKKAKVREAAIVLAYLWDIQYEYYIEHGIFINQQYFLVIFEADLGFGWFDRMSEEAREKLNYSSPSGVSHFWYVSQFQSGGSNPGMITHAYPKVEQGFFFGGGWSPEEIDNSLDGITLSVDNDRSIYIYGFGGVGNVQQL